MNCPKCNKEMKINHFQTVEYSQCPQCSGLWFDALEAEELVEIKDAAAIDTGNPKEGAKMNNKRHIKCPVCNVALYAVHDIKQPHIMLESCPSCHGTFFDAGEFKDFCEETFMDRIKDWRAKRR